CVEITDAPTNAPTEPPPIYTLYPHINTGPGGEGSTIDCVQTAQDYYGPSGTFAPNTLADKCTKGNYVRILTPARQSLEVVGPYVGPGLGSPVESDAILRAFHRTTDVEMEIGAWLEFIKVGGVVTNTLLETGVLVGNV